MKTTGTHDKFFSLLRDLPGAEKEQIVWQYSNMLTTSLREFYAKDPEGYKYMLAEMQVKANQAKGRKSVDPVLKTLRSSVLLRLQKHGVDTTEWKNINIFLLQPRIAGKLLFEMDADELRKLIAKMEQILRKDVDIRDKEIKLSTSN